MLIWALLLVLIQAQEDDLCPAGAVTRERILPGWAPSWQQHGNRPYFQAHACVQSPERARSICKHSRYATLFMHIPKTGGKEVAKCLHYHQGADWRHQWYWHHHFTDYQSVLQEVALQNELSAGCPLLLFTMLRQPADRVVSEWFHFGQLLLQTPTVADIFRQEGLSSGNLTRGMEAVFQFIIENPRLRNVGRAPVRDADQGMIKALRDEDLRWRLMEAYVSHRATGNFQVKFLLGYPIYSDLQIDESHLADVVTMMRCFDSNSSRTCDGRPLMVAGVLDRWDQTMQLLSELGLNVSECQRILDRVEHQNREIRSHVLTTQVPKRILEKIQLTNQLDQLLYDDVLKRYT